MKCTPRMLAIILTLFFLLGSTATFFPPALISALEAPEQDNVVACATPAELIQQLQENEGGTVTLTGNIVWRDEEDKDISYLSVSRPTVVKMGDFCFSIPQDCALFLDGPIQFEGSGTESPLFSVGGWLKTQNTKISAKGDGAVAMEIAPYGSWVSACTEVSADGEQATAVRVEGNEPLALETASISATGKNAVGIHAGGLVNATLCSIFSEGVSIFSESGEVVLDASQAEPEPDGAQMIQRKAVPSARLQNNGICIAAGSSQEDLLEKLDNPAFTLFDRDDILPPYIYTFGQAIWENLPEDLSKAGDFVATVTIPTPDRFPLELPVLEVPIHVVEPDAPFLQGAQDAGDAVFLRFFSEIEEDHAILRYSVEGENIWNDVMELPHSFLNADGANVEPLEHNRTYLFQLETKQEGVSRFSNILRFQFYDDINQNGGGDRDHGDREDQGETPPQGEIIPPSTHLSEEEETSVPEEWTGAPENETPVSSEAGQGTLPMEDEEKDEISSQANSDVPGVLPDGSMSVPKAAVPPVNSPDFIENKPKLPSSSKEIPTSIQKPPDTATVTLTASELADQLTANPQGITLLGEGMKVTLPASLVRNLPLAKGQSFSAELKTGADNRFRIHFWTGNEKLPDFGGESFSVGVSYASAVENPTDFLCKDAQGQRTFASGYENGKLIFQLASTGEYTIAAPETSTEPIAMVLSADKEDTPSPSPRPLSAWPFVVGGSAVTCALIGVAILWYKKKQKRR